MLSSHTNPCKWCLGDNSNRKQKSFSCSFHVLNLGGLCMYEKNVFAMCCLTALPVSRPWYWLCRSAGHPSSPLSQSSGSGSRRFTAMLCKMLQAATIVHTLSGAILTSEFSTWNLLFSGPNVLSMIHHVTLCAGLKCSSWYVLGLK